MCNAVVCVLLYHVCLRFFFYHICVIINSWNVHISLVHHCTVHIMCRRYRFLHTWSQQETIRLSHRCAKISVQSWPHQCTCIWMGKGLSINCTVSVHKESRSRRLGWRGEHLLDTDKPRITLHVDYRLYRWLVRLLPTSKTRKNTQICTECWFPRCNSLCTVRNLHLWYLKSTLSLY